MRAEGFQVDQAHFVLACVAQQVKLALATELVHPQLG